jgi:uncharacterized protein with von Willebrand factor type A (vWA) domain
LIAFRYYPFQPAEDSVFNTDQLTSLLSDLIMKYEMSLEEALIQLVESGEPLVTRVQSDGIESYISMFKEKINTNMVFIQNKYSLEPLVRGLERDYSLLSLTILRYLENEAAFYERMSHAIQTKNQDAIRRFKWDINSDKLKRVLYNPIEDILEMIAVYDLVKQGSADYAFQGETIPGLTEAIDLLQTLNTLKELDVSLDSAFKKGSFAELDLKGITKYLGNEMYQEFMETRERIYNHLKELLLKQGSLVEVEKGELRLSPGSIRKIGKRALNEIYSALKTGSSGERILTVCGDSERVLSSTRILEFGDNLSNIDFSSSMINSFIRGNGNRPRLGDLEVYHSQGQTNSSTVILLDMSASMNRLERFYNAKKVTLAMDQLIREDYKDEKLTVVGMGTFAKIIPISEIPLLQPYPITIYDPYIHLQYDLSTMKESDRKRIPLYFTNLQKGLSLARHVLTGSRYENKQIFLITDGSPTAHIKDSTLSINYPPSHADFNEALEELKNCVKENIVINTFLLSTEWDFNYFGEESFIKKFSRISKGRIFYPHPNELNKTILFDFINNKKKVIPF